MCNINQVPNELLELIFYYVDQASLRSQCIQVCSDWKQIIHSVEFWKDYHRFWCNSKPKKASSTESGDQNIDHSDRADSIPYDWVFYSYLNPRKNPFETNLLKNPDGHLVTPEELHSQDNRYYEDGFIYPWPKYPYWEIFSSNGKGWKVHKEPEIKPTAKNHNLLRNHPGSCFIASYHSCTKSQTIDLVEDYGISREILHDPKYEFEVDVLEWFIMQGPCRYELRVSFRDEKNRVIQELDSDSTYSNEFEKGTWAKCHRTAIICGVRQLRYITFYHGATCNEPVPTIENNVQAAIDTWTNVGTKMTGGSISLSYPKLTRLTKDEQLYSNRYVRHPKFDGGKTWYTIDSFGPLGNNKFSTGTYPITVN